MPLFIFPLSFREKLFGGVSSTLILLYNLVIPASLLLSLRAKWVMVYKCNMLPAIVSLQPAKNYYCILCGSSGIMKLNVKVVILTRRGSLMCTQCTVHMYFCILPSLECSLFHMRCLLSVHASIRYSCPTCLDSRFLLFLLACDWPRTAQNVHSTRIKRGCLPGLGAGCPFLDSRQSICHQIHNGALKLGVQAATLCTAADHHGHRANVASIPLCVFIWNRKFWHTHSLLFQLHTSL